MKLKKQQVITVSILTIVAFTLGTIGAGTVSSKAQSPETVIKASAQQADIANVICTNPEIKKEETVYVLSDATGKANKIIVSEWLKNTDHDKVLEDVSNLSDIENVRDDTTFTQNNNALSWATADGQDIYYQGTSKEKLPVTMDITYTLDGEKISAQDLIGKSGLVTITYAYHNTASTQVTIDGKKQDMYVPFMAATGFVLDNNKFKDVKVEHGQLMNDGSKSAVVLLAFPGLNENLALPENTVSLPDTCTVTAQVTDFEALPSMTLVTAQAFEFLNLSDTGSLDSVESSLTLLSQASDQLVAGTSTLYDGIVELMDKSGLMIEGINALNDGAKKVDLGAQSLQAGVKELKTGIDATAAGLNQLVENNDTLVQGANQIAASIFKAADGQLAAAGLKLPALTTENYTEVIAQVLAQLEAIKSDKAPQVAQQIAAVSALKAQLDSVSAFCAGVSQYTQGASQLATAGSQLSAGASKVSKGATDLQAGTKSVSDGLAQLASQSTLLTDGVTQLSEGAKAIRDGMKELDETGIDAMVSLVGDNLEQVGERLKAMVNVAKEYQSFGGKEDTVSGSVKFIIKCE